MYTNKNRFDASFVKVIVLFTYWNQSVQQSIPIVHESTSGKRNFLSCKQIAPEIHAGYKINVLALQAAANG